MNDERTKEIKECLEKILDIARWGKASPYHRPYYPRGIEIQRLAEQGLAIASGCLIQISEEDRRTEKLNNDIDMVRIREVIKRASEELMEFGGDFSDGGEDQGFIYRVAFYLEESIR